MNYEEFKRSFMDPLIQNQRDDEPPANTDTIESLLLQLLQARNNNDTRRAIELSQRIDAMIPRRGPKP